MVIDKSATKSNSKHNLCKVLHIISVVDHPRAELPHCHESCIRNATAIEIPHPVGVKFGKGDIDLPSVLRYEDPPFLGQITSKQIRARVYDLLEIRIWIFLYPGHYLRDLLHGYLWEVHASGVYLTLDNGFDLPRVDILQLAISQGLVSSRLSLLPNVSEISNETNFSAPPHMGGCRSKPARAFKKVTILLFTALSSILVSLFKSDELSTSHWRHSDDVNSPEFCVAFVPAAAR
jgi:hypothetical protein